MYALNILLSTMAAISCLLVGQELWKKLPQDELMLRVTAWIVCLVAAIDCLDAMVAK